MGANRERDGVTNAPGQPVYNDWAIRDWVRIVSCHKLLIVGSLLLGVSVAGVIWQQTTPRYEAEAQVVLDMRSTRIVKFDAVLSNLPPQPDVLRTEMDVISSRTMAERVTNRLSDADKERLLKAETTLPPLRRLLRDARALVANQLNEWLVSKSEATASPSGSPDAQVHIGGLQPDVVDELVDIVIAGLNVSNNGESYTIRIAFSAANPVLAATVANDYAEAYLANQVELKMNATERASGWLSQRLTDLRHDLEASEAAVQAYRRAAGILEDKGSTVTAQQRGEVSSQLVVARNQRVEAESRLMTVRSLLQGGGDIGAISDVMLSPVIQVLKQKLADLKSKEAEVNSRYTDQYPGMKDMRTDLAEVQRQIDSEVSRVVKSLANQVEIARNKESALESDLARLEDKFGQGTEAEVRLKQLQREADANRAVYEAYLNRFKETTGQQSLQEPDSYLISRAVPPQVPSYPRRMPLFVLGALFGAFMGVGLALCRELFDLRLHSIVEVEQVTGLPVLALLPALSRYRLGRPENHVLRKPGSVFNEALRTTRAAVALSHGGNRAGKVLLATSAIAAEGKTSFCLSQARSLARDGVKVLLIDADMRRPGVARAFGARGTVYLTDFLGNDEVELADAVQIDEKSGAHFIAARSDTTNPQGFLYSERMALLIEQARAAYDIVIIDAPPILVVADAAIVARFADHCLFFIRWGATARDYVANALRRLDLYKVAVSGVVLSHVNMRRYAHYAAGEGYYDYGAPRRSLFLSRHREASSDEGDPNGYDRATGAYKGKRENGKRRKRKSGQFSIDASSVDGDYQIIGTTEEARAVGGSRS
jgi:capsular exopolysaccharide synthesis family protein